MSDTNVDLRRTIRDKVGGYLDVIEKEQHGDFTAKTVPFTDLWKWAGFKQKCHAKRMLLQRLVETRDYEVLSQKGENPLGGRPTEEILLTVDAAKKFLLKAQTPEGDAACDYFILCEREWRQCRNAIRDGEIAVEDTRTGQRIDNSKNIPLCKDRLTHVAATKQTSQAIKACGGDQGDQVRKNIMVTEAATGGLGPSAFKDAHGVKDKKISARSLMGQGMLGGATMAEMAFENVLKEHEGRFEEAFRHFEQLKRNMIAVTKYIQDDVLQKPLCPDDARKVLQVPQIAAPAVGPTLNNHANTINNYFAPVATEVKK